MCVVGLKATSEALCSTKQRLQKLIVEKFPTHLFLVLLYCFARYIETMSPVNQVYIAVVGELSSWSMVFPFWFAFVVWSVSVSVEKEWIVQLKEQYVLILLSNMGSFIELTVNVIRKVLALRAMLFLHIPTFLLLVLLKYQPIHSL